MDDIKVTEQKVFHVQLKNGHYYDFGGCTARRDVRYENNHLIITTKDRFTSKERIRAVFDMSKVAYAVTTMMYFNWDTMTLTDKPPKEL